MPLTRDGSQTRESQAETKHGAVMRTGTIEVRGEAKIKVEGTNPLLATKDVKAGSLDMRSRDTTNVSSTSSSVPSSAPSVQITGNVQITGDAVIAALGAGAVLNIGKKSPELSVAEKLIKLRTAVLKDEYIDNELSCYVEPNGESENGIGDLSPLYDWVVKNLLEGEAQTLLLQGQAGAGKTTFSRYLQRKIWERKEWDDFKVGSPVPKCYVPLFIPLGSAKTDSKKLLDYLRNQPGIVEKFTEDEINILLRDYHTCILADGYDEMPGNQTLNLYDVNSLQQYNDRIKLLVSCRSQRAYELNENDSFVPHDASGRLLFSLYKKRYVAAFDERQIASYIEKYITKNKSRTDITVWSEIEKYLKHINIFPGLERLINTPFLLMITVEVLPQIITEIEKDKQESKEIKIHEITRAKLYDRFMDNWFNRQATKLQQAGISQKDVVKTFRQFCVKFAECLREVGIITVQYPWEEEDLFAKEKDSKEDSKSARGLWIKQLFSEDNPKIFQARKSSPLRTDKIDDIRIAYQFIHPSLIDYFLTTSIYNLQPKPSKITLPKTTIALPPPLTITEAESKDSIEEDPTLTPRSSETLLSQALMTHDQWNFLADRVKADEAFKAYLFSLIEKSKSDASYAITAANAISTLNAARVSFSEMDFRGIKIPGADLSYAILDNAQLQNADLSKVTLQCAWLRQTNFSGTVMTSVQFGEWPYLQFPDVVHTCAYSKDGHWLAVGCDDHDVYLFDTRKNKQTYALKGHKGPVTTVAFDAKSERVVSGSFDRTICLWEVASGKLLHTLMEHTSSVNVVAFDAKSELLASGSSDGTIYLWEAMSGRLLHALKGHTASVKAIAFDATGKHLASGSLDSTILLWEAMDGKPPCVLNKHTGYVDTIAFDGKGKLLASSSEDFKIHLWEVASGRLLRTLEGHTDCVWAVVFDVKGEQIASGSYDKTIRLWDVASGKLLRILEGHKNRILTVAFDHKGEHLVSGSNDKTIRFWKVGSEKLHRTLESYADSVKIIAFDAKGDCLASVSQTYKNKDNTICLWEVLTGKQLCVLKGHKGSVKAIVFNDQGECLASGRHDNTICFWDVASGKLLRTLEMYTRSVSSIIFDTKGERLALASNDDKTIRLWKVANRELLLTLEGHMSRVDTIAFDVKGERLASGSYDGTIRVWNVASGKQLNIIEAHTGWVTSVAFDTKGEYLASGSRDNTICLWEVVSGKLLRTLDGHINWVRIVVFDPKGERLASGSWDKTMRLWEVRSGKCLLVISGFNGNVTSLAWKEIGKDSFIVSGCKDKAVRVFQIFEDKKGKLRAVLRWSSYQAALTASEACLEGVRGLGEANLQLLQQCGAVGKPVKPAEIKQPPAPSNKKFPETELIITSPKSAEEQIADAKAASQAVSRSGHDPRTFGSSTQTVQGSALTPLLMDTKRETLDQNIESKQQKPSHCSCIIL